MSPYYLTWRRMDSATEPLSLQSGISLGWVIMQCTWSSGLGYLCKWQINGSENQKFGTLDQVAVSHLSKCKDPLGYVHQKGTHPSNIPDWYKCKDGNVWSNSCPDWDCTWIPLLDHVVERPLSKKCIIKEVTMKLNGPWKHGSLLVTYWMRICTNVQFKHPIPKPLDIQCPRW